jgi:hypothetical protein
VIPSKKRSRRYRGRTEASSRFSTTSQRTRELLAIGLAGHKQSGTSYDQILRKFEGAKGIRGRPPRGYQPSIEARRIADDKLEMSLDMRTAAHIRAAIQFAIRQHALLRFHLYSIILVYAWGALETYLTMVFEEICRRQPQLLKSGEMIAIADVVEKRDSLLDYLIGRQTEKIGNYGLKDLLGFLRDRINYAPSPLEIASLEEIYLLRNIIAHRTGVLRPNQRQLLPQGVAAAGNELRIGKEYLQRALGRIDRAVTRIERHIARKFYRSVRRPRRRANDAA